MLLSKSHRFWIMAIAAALLIAAAMFTLQQMQVFANEETGKVEPETMNLASTGDKVLDEKLHSHNVFFTVADDVKPLITEEEAIQSAKQHRPALAEKAKSISAQFVKYTNTVDGTEERPIWLVTLEGVSVPMRGPVGLEKKEPDYENLKTLIYVDAGTGDVVELVSMGYN